MGGLDPAAFGAGRLRRRAVLVLDIAGFTATAPTLGEVAAFVRIMAVQRVVAPVPRAHGATLVRAFADDLVALFDLPGPAPAAAFEAHRRVAAGVLRGHRLGRGVRHRSERGHGQREEPRPEARRGHGGRGAGRR
ncbi:hypothetical protein ACIGNX_08005 [Actinosynnema sp. NPDC053489]|uniref:hypothetical protein n=1 Tax=Actinosynnema sp. NPDC053489 TaxID=3363916 RepID=UPI0037C9447E